MFTLVCPTVLLLLLTGRRILIGLAWLSDHAFTCVAGYLRPHPDPWLEITLREAFAEFDRDLKVLMHD
jgi:hypothetical protein